MQAGGFPEPELVHYNPKDFDFGKKKAFPFRDQVTYYKLQSLAGWIYISQSKKETVATDRVVSCLLCVLVTDAE